MASGTIRKNFTSHSTPYALIVEWSSTATTSSNSSVVRATAKLYCPYALSISGRSDNSIIINGTTYYFNSSAISTSGGTYTLGTVTSNAITHNTDGSKAVTITCKFKLNATIGSTSYTTVTATGTATLDDIPRAASIVSAPNFTDEGNPTITYSNPAGNAVESLEACISLDGSGAEIAYRSISKTGTSYTFELTSAERTVLRNATTTSNTRTVRFYVRTVIGGVSYLRYLEKTLTIVNANPTISSTVKDTNSTTIALTGDENVLVRYYSDVSVSITATAKKGATIQSRTVTHNGKKVATSGGATFNDVINGTFVINVTDSRGNSTSKTVTKTLIEYAKLSCVIGNNKPDADGDFTFKVTGNYFNGSFGSVANTLTVYYRYKEINGSFGSWTTMSKTLSGNTYTATASLTGLDYLTTYVFEAYAVDKLATVYSESKNIKTTPVFDWGESDFNFNVNVGFGNAGTVLRRNGENGNIVLSSPADATDGIFIRPNGTGSGTGQTIFYKSGMVYVGGDVKIPHNQVVYGIDTNGEIHNALYPCNGNNNTLLGYGGWQKALGNTNIYGNNVNIFTNTKVSIDKKLTVGDTLSVGGREYGINKVLWSGGYYMSNTHTATLSDTVSKQPHGIVLVFSAYFDSASQNESFSEHFVPKQIVENYPGHGHNFNLNGQFANGVKYLYIHDAEIVGSQYNTGSRTVGSVTLNNSYYVLRYVFGV